MTQVQIRISNLTTGYLSLDARDDKFSKKILRATLGPVGQPAGVRPLSYVDAATYGWTLQDLNENDQITSLLTSSPPKIGITVIRGTTDIWGAVDAVADSVGLGDTITKTQAFAAAGAGARDITLYSANFPFAARIIDYMLMVSTAAAGTITLRSATGGGGSALSQAVSTAAAGRVRDDGTGMTSGDGVVQTIAKSGSLIARDSAGTSAGTIIVTFQRTA